MGHLRAFCARLLKRLETVLFEVGSSLVGIFVPNLTGGVTFKTRSRVYLGLLLSVSPYCIISDEAPTYN